MINFSELLWHPGRPKSQRFGTFVVDERSKIEHSSLQRIPTERAQVEPGSRLALMGDPLSVGADRFRYLRMRLMELRELAKLRSVMITSPLPADGKSTIATCLATSLSEGGRYSTLLVESDLHHPSITRTLRLRPQAGVAECVEDGLDPMSVVRKIDPFGWFLLQAGEPKGNPTELLQSAAFSAMMQNLTPHFDWILVDSPPAIPLTDALALSRQVDATLVVVRAECTPRDAIEECIKLIGRKHVLGIVLNGADTLAKRYSQYYGHYAKH